MNIMPAASGILAFKDRTIKVKYFKNWKEYSDLGKTLLPLLQIQQPSTL
jgi:hypothetical protein